jgi:hypothetical protein
MDIYVWAVRATKVAEEADVYDAAMRVCWRHAHSSVALDIFHQAAAAAVHPTQAMFR